MNTEEIFQQVMNENCKDPLHRFAELVRQDEREQAEKQEPVAFETWLSRQHGDPEEIGFLQALKISYEAGQDSAPPKREWVGLTDEEIAQTVGSPIDEVYLVDFRRVIEKLRSKNT